MLMVRVLRGRVLLGTTIVVRIAWYVLITAMFVAIVQLARLVKTPSSSTAAIHAKPVAPVPFAITARIQPPNALAA